MGLQMDLEDSQGRIRLVTSYHWCLWWSVVEEDLQQWSEGYTKLLWKDLAVSEVTEGFVFLKSFLPEAPLCTPSYPQALKFQWEPKPLWWTVGELVKMRAVLGFSNPLQELAGLVPGLCGEGNMGPGLTARSFPAHSWDVGQRKGGCWHRNRDLCLSEGWKLLV